jgi:hypothetical protein
MVATGVAFRSAEPGTYDYHCRGCWSRAWVNPDGSTTVTRNADETIAEIKRRMPENKETASSAAHAA